MRCHTGNGFRSVPFAALLSGVLLSLVAGIAGVVPARAQDVPATVSTGSAVWNEGGVATFVIDNAVGTAGTDWSLNKIKGTLTFSSGTTSGSTFTLDVESILYHDSSDGSDTGTQGALAGFNPEQSYTWDFVQTTGGIVNYDPAKVTIDSSEFAANNDMGSGQFSLETLNGGKDLALQFISSSDTPEPSSALLLPQGIAVVLLLGRRTRRRGEFSLSGICRLYSRPLRDGNTNRLPNLFVMCRMPERYSATYRQS